MESPKDGLPSAQEAIKAPWHERWRNFVRLGETTFVLALWIGGITGGDIMIAVLLLLAGAIVGVIAICAEPARSRRFKTVASLLIVLFFTGTAFLVMWRHGVDAPKPASQTPLPPVAQQGQSPPTPITKAELDVMIRQLTAKEPSPRVAPETKKNLVPSKVPIVGLQSSNIRRDDTVALDCYLAPTATPAGIREVAFGYAGELYDHSGDSTQKSGFISYECLFRNYGEVIPLLSVTFIPKYYHLFKSGAKTSADAEMPPLPPADKAELRFDNVPAQGQTEPFLLKNISPYLIVLDMPSYVSINGVGSNGLVSVNIITDPREPLVMWPNNDLMPK